MSDRPLRLNMLLCGAPDKRRYRQRILSSEMVRVLQHGMYVGEGIVEDASEIGFRLLLDVQLTPGEHVLIETPDDLCTVLVRYCALGDPEMFEAGVEFITATDDMRYLM